jgi:hypothetical protein
MKQNRQETDPALDGRCIYTNVDQFHHGFSNSAYTHLNQFCITDYQSTRWYCYSLIAVAQLREMKMTRNFISSICYQLFSAWSSDLGGLRWPKKKRDIQCRTICISSGGVQITMKDIPREGRYVGTNLDHYCITSFSMK